MKKIFLSFGILASLLSPFAVQADFNSELNKYILNSMAVIAQKCQISIPLNATGFQQATCVGSRISASVQTCIGSEQDLTRMNACINSSIQANASVLDACIPGLTAEQKTCAIGGAIGASDAAIQTAADTANRLGLPTSISPQSGGSATTYETSGFQPLTSIPAVTAFKADGFAAFFNQLYILCVGIAAVIAVLQFIRAGVYYSLTDTGVTEKREARHMMVMSVTGLILVLSPTIVFGIINPDILKLKIGLESLNLSPVERVDGVVDGSSSSSSCSALAAIIRNDSGASPTSSYAPSVWFSGGDEGDAKTACCSTMDAVGGESKCTVTINNGTYANWCDCSKKTTEVAGAEYIVDSIYVTYSSLIFSEMGSTESNSVYVLKPGTTTTYPSNAVCEKTYNSIPIPQLKSMLGSFKECYWQTNTGFVKYSCTGTITADNSNYAIDKTVCTIKK